MLQLNPYLNFDGQTEKAFQFYQSVFGGELVIQKMREAPGVENFTEEEKNLIMHASILLSNGQVLMGSDIIKSYGHSFTQGTNHYISLHAESRAEADHLFAALSEGGEVEMPLADMFWGDYFGSFKDQYGVCWMINYALKF
ncbi:VOC family protein [Siphonobacter sp. SORGH_AS_0500]|uniref:VOC family protein n=1 Tax=Siphonobacter sp. SORGH_AS_0500 TaxID=1864824 RepID=UPI000CADBF13|nr:VOC family protein [Siphonobacter sp. SORGH_AS_0500]MDR6196104.1 PhnB protein [Siphonobacter sp. SORGH_AS_0500]PKK35567.1 VOC family protein [Siphonobacter sp. SORGH_AS_0500]